LGCDVAAVEAASSGPFKISMSRAFTAGA
jgi:hypothetical protein